MQYDGIPRFTDMTQWHDTSYKHMWWYLPSTGKSTDGLPDSALNILYYTIAMSASHSARPSHTHTYLSPIYTYLQVACCCICRLSTLRLKYFTDFCTSPALWHKRWDGPTEDNRTKKRDGSFLFRWKFVWVLYYTQNKQNMYWTSRCGGSRSRYSTRNRKTFPGNILCVFVWYMMQCNDVRNDRDILYTIYYIRRMD